MANAEGQDTGEASAIGEALVSRWQFLGLCVASIMGLSLLGLAGCGSSQDGGDGGGGNGKKDNKDDGGGGAGGY